MVCLKREGVPSNVHFTHCVKNYGSDISILAWPLPSSSSVYILLTILINLYRCVSKSGFREFWYRTWFLNNVLRVHVAQLMWEICNSSLFFSSFIFNGWGFWYNLTSHQGEHLFHEKLSTDMEDAKIVGWFLEMRFSDAAALFSSAIEGIDYLSIELLHVLSSFSFMGPYANLLLAVTSCTIRERSEQICQSQKSTCCPCKPA